MKRTVLFLTGEMGLGGGAMFVRNICDGLRTSEGGWTGIAGVFSKLGSIGQETKDAGHPVIGPFPDALIHEDVMEAMFRECARLRPDAVVANLGGDSFDFMRFVPEGVLRIGMIHSDREHVYQIIESYSSWLDVVVAVSKHSADHLADRGRSKNVSIANVPCGIPVSPAIRTPSDGKLRVLYLGRIEEEQKRVSLMARIIRESIQRDPRIEWTLVGDGPQAGETRAALDGVPGLTFTGALSYQAAREEIPKHDVYFLCSDYEGLPLSMLEAMSAGLVPVVSDLPSGISEVVTNENGLRIPVDDEEAYVEALIALASDPERLESMSAKACEDVQEFYSIEAMASRWKTLLASHAKQGKSQWYKTCSFDPPPILQKSWIHQPVFRPLRRFLKRFVYSTKTHKS